MFTRSRRPQGFQVRKSRIQRPLDYFAQNGIQVPVTEETDPVKAKAKKDAETYVNNLLNAPRGWDKSRPYENQVKPLAGEPQPQEEAGFLDYIQSLPQEAVSAAVNYLFGGDEEAAPTAKRLSHPQRPSGDSFPSQGPFDVLDTSGNAPAEFAGDTSSGVKAIKEPTQQPQVQTQQPQGGTYMPNQKERKFIQRWYESSNNPKADSGAAGGLYGISPGALKDAIRDGIVPEGSDVYNADVNEKVRNYYLDQSYNTPWVKNATNKVSRLARTYARYNQGGEGSSEGFNAAQAAGFDINPRNADEVIALMDAKGGGEYDGYFWPKETRDYVKAIVAGQLDPTRLPKDFKLGQMDEGGRLEEGDPIDPKKLAMYAEAFKKTMGDNYANVPPEMISNITDLVAGGDLLSKTDEVSAQLDALRKLGLDTDLLFQNLTEAEGGGFGAKMKYGAAARMFSE